MPPAKKAPAVEEPEEPAEPAEAEAVPEKRCFRVGGQVYWGLCKHGSNGTFVRHGGGQQIVTAKSVSDEDVVLYTYDGNWKDDEMDGDGSFSWPDGSSYIGAFSKGQIHGYGTYKWPEGSTYTGDWVRGRMNGRGRFNSMFDGDFIESDSFYRDFFQAPRLNGKWLCITEEHKKAERLSIAEGNPATMSVRRCYEREQLPAVLAAAAQDGLVPFLVSDTSMPSDPSTSPAAWAAACGVLDASSTVSLRDAEVQRRRCGDYLGPFFKAVQCALLSKQSAWCTVLWEDEDLPELPEAWKLKHFMSEQSLPLEAFHPKLFNGRHMALPFLPREIQDELDAYTRDPMAQCAQASGLPAEEAPDAGEGDGTSIPAPSLPAPPRVYHLRFMMAASSRLPGGLSDEEARDWLIRRYSAHVPLHRCAAVVLCAPPPAEE